MDHKSDCLEYIPSEEDPPPSAQIEDIELAHAMAIAGNKLESEIVARKMAIEILDRTVALLADNDQFSTNAILENDIANSRHPLKNRVFQEIENTLVEYGSMYEGPFEPNFLKAEAVIVNDVLRAEIEQLRLQADEVEANLPPEETPSSHVEETMAHRAWRKQWRKFRRRR